MPGKRSHNVILEGVLLAVKPAYFGDEPKLARKRNPDDPDVPVMNLVIETDDGREDALPKREFIEFPASALSGNGLHKGGAVVVWANAYTNEKGYETLYGQKYQLGVVRVVPEEEAEALDQALAAAPSKAAARR